MKRITITPDEIVDGMVLAEPIMKSTGQILFALHMQLEPKHIQTFKTWGIENFAVFVGEQKEVLQQNSGKAEEADIRAEAEKLLKKRMRWEPRNKNEIDLYEMGIDSIAENYF